MFFCCCVLLVFALLFVPSVRGISQNRKTFNVKIIYVCMCEHAILKYSFLSIQSIDKYNGTKLRGIMSSSSSSSIHCTCIVYLQHTQSVSVRRADAQRAVSAHKPITLLLSMDCVSLIQLKSTEREKSRNCNRLFSHSSNE